MQFYDSSKVVVSFDPDMAVDFIESMGDMNDAFRFLPHGGLGEILGYGNLTFIFLEDYNDREDVHDILEYANKNNCKVLYLEYWRIHCPVLH